MRKGHCRDDRGAWKRVIEVSGSRVAFCDRRSFFFAKALSILCRVYFTDTLRTGLLAGSIAGRPLYFLRIWCSGKVVMVFTRRVFYQE